jgi:hypothetical protein
LNQRITLHVRKRPRTSCPRLQGRLRPWRMLPSARPLGLAVIRRNCGKRRCFVLESMTDPVRLLGTEPRRWEAPMLRSRVTELHYITPVANLGSIVAYGVLSHNRAAQLPHTSVASEEVQALRAHRRVPRGWPLHDYANLYFDARNAMMYKRKDDTVPLAVVRLHPNVLDLPGSVITDGNAASNNTIFLPSPGGLKRLDEEKSICAVMGRSRPMDEGGTQASSMRRVACAKPS